MTEGVERAGMRWWLKAVIVGGVALIVLVGLWIRLPVIAEFGCRFGPTRDWSIRLLGLAGPRAVDELIEAFDNCPAQTSTALIRQLRSVCAKAEDDDRARLVLLDSLGNVDATNSAGLTVLHLAAAWGHLRLVESLLERGADVNARTDAGMTPLEAAASQGRLAVVLLLERNGAEIDSRGSWGRTPLLLAAEYRYPDVASELVSKGASVTARDSEGITALHWAARAGLGQLTSLLIARGAEVNATSEDGTTPLHWVAVHGYRTTATLLLSAAANVNAVDARGRTPLDIAVDYENDDFAALLREHGGKAGEELEAEAKAAGVRDD